jgi:sortase (surface protein transpeptidase)
VRRKITPRRAGAPLPTLLGLAGVVTGIALIVAVVAIALSRSGDEPPSATARPPARMPDLAADAAPRAEGQNRPRRAASRPPARPARPVQVSIPSIGVHAPIVPLGLNPDRTLEVPKDFDDTGWWTGGPRPGERGPAVIAGHVDSYTGPAVFYRLRELRPGDAIVVLRRDGTRARFTVRRSEQYPKNRFPTARVYGPTPGPTLRLITCGGEFDDSTGHYLDNTVVYAAAR